MTYTEKELDQFLHGISLSLLSKKSAQHWRYDEETAREIEWLEALERKVRADKADRKTEPFDKDINVRSKDEPQTEEHCENCRHKDECEGATYEYKNTEWWCLAYAPIDEPQTDVYDYKGNGKWERSE